MRLAVERLELTATDLDLEGRGVARVDDLEIHVDGLLPGEEGVVVLEHVSRQSRRAFGSGEPRVRSPDRVEPPCPGRCGGAWQHLAYAAQLEHKRRRIQLALGEIPVAPVVPAPALTGYRNKATFVIGEGCALGAYAPRSHAWADTARCRVVHPAFAPVVATAPAALARSGLAVYREADRTGQLRYLILRASRAGQVLAGIATTSDAPRQALEAAAAELLATDGVAGVLWLPNDATSGAILGAGAQLLAGVATIAEEIAGIHFEVAIDTFLQINLTQAEAMYRRLAELVSPVAAIDLYCGIGPIALVLARRGARVLGIERNPAAVAAARAAAAANQIAARFEGASAGALPRLVDDHPVDLVVLNPPRQGLAPEVRRELAAAGPPLLAYVSCGPDSLGRDLAELPYRVERVEPFDLMPGTGHVETLVMARRDRP
jgi:23S rRNA (uracil1939-C5)-methyltransferase